MKKNSYSLISTPEFADNKKKKEFIPIEDRQIITTKNKNGDENESFFSFSKNNCSYHEINECSSKIESSNSNKNSENNIKYLLQKESGSYNSRGLKNIDASKEMSNKTSEIFPGKVNPSSKYNSRNYGKTAFNNTATLSKQKIKTLPNTSNSNSKRTKITPNSNIDENKVQKPQKTSENKRHSSPKTKISHKNTTSIMANNRTTTVKNITTAKSIKSIKIKENIFNKNNSFPNKEIKEKNISKYFPLNNFVYISNLSNKEIKIPNVSTNFGKYRKKKVNLNKINQEENVIGDSNIHDIKGNSSLEKTMKDIADKLNDLSNIHADYLESQTILNNNLTIVNQKLDSYLEQQSDINAKLSEFLDNVNK